MKKQNSFKSLLFLGMLFCWLFPVLGDSLFKSANPLTASMFSDKRARKIGDIITIYISESSTSDYSGATNLKQQTDLTNQIKSLLFPPASSPTTSTDALYRNAPYLGSRAGMHRGTLPESEWAEKTGFKGDGQLTSSEKISGIITAMIIEVLPNGNFIIEGRRQVSVDDQLRTIVLSGIVRPDDIGPDNSTLSRLIADAKISFIGNGPITTQRKRGILTRFFNFLGLY